MESSPFSDSRTTRGPMERILTIHSLASVGKCPTVKKLSRRFEVTPRTIERDLEFMRDRLRAPLVYNRSTMTYSYSEPFELPSLRLTEGEMIVLYLGERLLVQSIGTPYEKYIRSAMDKLKTFVCGDVVIDPNDLQDAISFRIPPLRGDEAVVAYNYSRLYSAIQNCQVVNITYYAPSTDEVSIRETEPYHLMVKEGACYLIAYCRLREAFRMFALDRIRELEVTDRVYTPDTDFDIDAYMESCFDLEKGQVLDVELKFDAHQTRWIRERCWHESQEFTELPDGTSILKFTAEGVGAITRWVLQFGSHVEVVSPDELRESVAYKVRRMFMKYWCRDTAAPKST